MKELNPETVIFTEVRDSPFTINNILYNGITDIEPGAATIVTTMEDSDFDIYETPHQKYILRYWRLFPCFDSSDRMTETRYNRRYMICDSMEEAVNKYRYIKSVNESFNFINGNSPKLAPLIYADDGMPDIKILTLTIKYIPRPLITDTIDLPQALLSKIELFAKNVHEEWSNKKMTDGWQYGPVFNDQNKCHPGLVPYEELTEDEKSYDRLTALSTLKMAVSLGFKIE